MKLNCTQEESKYNFGGKNETEKKYMNYFKHARNIINYSVRSGITW